MIVTSGHLGHMICNYWSWYFYRDLPYKFRDTVFKNSKAARVSNFVVNATLPNNS